MRRIALVALVAVGLLAAVLLDAYLFFLAAFESHRSRGR